jgi:hypothetical protein
VCVVVVGGVKAVRQAVRTGVGIIDGSDLYSLHIFTFFDLSGIGGQGVLNEIVGITRREAKTRSPTSELPFDSQECKSGFPLSD